jgi:hypothetical protein
MTLLRNMRWFFAVVVIGVLAMLVMVGTTTTRAEASITRNYDAVAMATDSSPPALLLVERDTAGTTATRMSTLEGVVRSADRPLDGRTARDGISSIWILPVALVGVGILARQLLSGSGNWHLWRSSPAEQKGNPRRTSAGMKPGLGGIRS